MIDSDKKSNTFLLIIFVIAFVSILVTYYRYVVRQDFQYFTTEDEIPDQFDPSTYTNQL